MKKESDGAYRSTSRGSSEKIEGSNSAPDDNHVTPTKGDLNTIAGGFACGGLTSSSRKRYAKSVMLVSVEERHFPTHPPLIITSEDFEGIYPHEDDPMVISVVATDYRVKMVLIDQGSSTDTLYWDTFLRLGLDKDLMQPFVGSLVGFLEE